MFVELRCPTVWLSGGAGETPSQLCTISGKSRLHGAAEPLSAEAGVGRVSQLGLLRPHRLPPGLERLAVQFDMLGGDALGDHLQPQFGVQFQASLRVTLQQGRESA